MDKYCSGCSSTKTLDDFRYIEYFDSYRTICIACESKKKKASKIKRLKHIKKHGVTEGALRGINISAYIGARREAKNIVLSKQKKIYDLVISKPSIKETQALLEQYLCETKKYLSKLNNHPSYDEMLNLINFSKKRRK